MENPRSGFDDERGRSSRSAVRDSAEMNHPFLAPKQRQTESTNPAERDSPPSAEVLQALPEIVRKSLVESTASSRPLPPPAINVPCVR